jgi:lipopolysaccharide heptosyltransferase II
MNEIPEPPAAAPVLRPRHGNPRPHFTGGRILVKEVNWLGDLVMTMPALRAIRAAFAMSSLTVLVARQLAGLFDGMSWIDEVIPYRPATGIETLARDWEIIRAIRSRHFDLAILFPNSFGSALWATLAGVPRRAGYATDARRLMLTHHAAPSTQALTLHQSHYWLRMVRDTLGVEAPDGVTEHQIEPSNGNLAHARDWLAEHRFAPEAPLIAIAPAAAYGPAKEWPLVRYAALIDRLSERYDAECVIVGTAAERVKCEQVAATARPSAIVAAGELGVGELCGLLSLCNGFAGNDSGAMHLAGAVGIPTVGIFGSTNPVRTGPTGHHVQALYHPPSCSPCLERTCRFGHYDCLRAVSPEEVAATLAHLGAFARS